MLIGILLFALYGIVNNNSNKKNVILIDDLDMDNLISKWEMQWKRVPTERELKNLVDQNIRQEIFYQEALKMNLDHNDEIIKRRLAQKMQFLSDDLASINEPTEDELKKYYDENFEKYLRPYSYSFYQIIFTADKRTDPKNDAETTLRDHKKASFEEMKDRGDKLPFPYFYDNIDEDRLTRELGSKFSLALQSQGKNNWIGPISSGFGQHLVFVTGKTIPSRPEFAEIKDALVRDKKYDDQQNFNNLIYQELKKNYDIEINIDPNKFESSFVEFLKEEKNNE